MSYVATASPTTLRQRAAVLAAIRAFFAGRDVLEVETPALSPAGVPDPALESVIATVQRLGTRPYYLQTSPEFAMKRLLAAGSGDIYQLCRVFRDDELGRWHQPEFTLLEWYRIGWDEQQLMSEVEALLATALAAVSDSSAADGRGSVRVRYADALHHAIGASPETPTPTLVAILNAAGIDVPADLPHDAVLDLAFSTAVIASFDASTFTFVYDYPASQAALARLKPGVVPAVAARFEVFSGGIELANGFHELTDAREQRQRFVADLAARHSSGRHVPPLDEDLLAALTAGLPDCAGVAVGVDRLVALATGHGDVASTMSFAHTRPND
jgi:lysyl-tRNA synthetase class 2